MHLYRVVRLAVLGLFIGTATLFFVERASAQQQPRPVENVDVIGNLRIRKDDIVYYIQTRAGDTYNPSQVERDLQALNALGFFDKTETRVTIEDGPRGGVNVTFYVKELPIIRDIQFEGLKSVSESDVLKTFREKRVGVSKEAIEDPVKGLLAGAPRRAARRGPGPAAHGLSDFAHPVPFVHGRYVAYYRSNHRRQALSSGRHENRR